MKTDLTRYSDQFLVLAAIAGDFESFDELVRRYRPAVLRTVARIVNNPERAEDIVQESLILAFEKLPQLTAPEAFGPWLRTIATRHARRRSRQARARDDVTSPLTDVLLAVCKSVSDGPEDSLLATSERGALRRRIASLPPKYAETLDLRFFGDMPLSRIAAYQGITVDGVKWRLKRALRLLRERTAGDADAAEPGAVAS